MVCVYSTKELETDGGNVKNGESDRERGRIDEEVRNQLSKANEFWRQKVEDGIE